MTDLITSRVNPVIRQVRSLQQKKERQASGLFLAEGIHLVGEALKAGWEVVRLVYAPGSLQGDYAWQLVKEVTGSSIPCSAVSDEVFTSIAGKENPQGILAVVRQQHRHLDTLDLEHFTQGVALLAPQDPGNVGTILRTLDSAGVGVLFLLDGGVELYHPTVVRASMGAIFWISVIHAEFQSFVLWIQAHGLHLLGSSAHARRNYQDHQFPRTGMVLLLGSEQKGLSSEQIEVCEAVLSIPMKGHSSSLNLAVAAGILVYRMVGK